MTASHLALSTQNCRVMASELNYKNKHVVDSGGEKAGGEMELHIKVSLSESVWLEYRVS